MSEEKKAPVQFRVSSNVVGKDGKTFFSRGQVVTHDQAQSAKLDAAYLQPIGHPAVETSNRMHKGEATQKS